VLEVTATMPEGPPLKGHLKGRDVTRVLLPKRDLIPGTKIGDAFDRGNKPDDADDEKIDGNDHNGDGLTVYEEYRGVMAKDSSTTVRGHQRLHPQSKDLIVENRLGMDISAGLKRFRDASKIVPTELKDGQLRPDKVVNANTSSAHVQHGVRYVLHTFTDAADARTIGQEPDSKKHTASPGDCDDLWINEDMKPHMTEAKWVPRYDNTIAHEIGHCLGADHHGDVPINSPIGFATQLLDYDGTPLKNQDFKQVNENAVNSPKGQDNGDPDCIMTYPEFEWVQLHDVQDVGGKRTMIYRKVHKTPFGTTFCTGPDGKTKKSEFGPAVPGRGSCFQKLNVRDK
jgi:hypothetical protein